MKFKTKLTSTHSLIDLTPLVDVVFLLLIFFMVTSNVLPLKSLNVNNPKLNKDSTPLTSQILVVMDSRHVIYVGAEKDIVDLVSLKDYLHNYMEIFKTSHPGSTPSIALSIDQKVDYASFLKLFSIVQDVSPKVRLVYEPSEKSDYFDVLSNIQD